MDKSIEQRINRLEDRQDKTDDKVSSILQEISSFKPILTEINKNIEKLSENAVDKERVIKLENQVDGLDKKINEETINKKAKLFEEIVKFIIITLLGAVLGYVIKK